MKLTEERIKFSEWLATLKDTDVVFMRFPHHLFMFYNGDFPCLADVTLSVSDIREGLKNPSGELKGVYLWLRDKALVDCYIIMEGSPSNDPKYNYITWQAWWEGEPCEDMM